MKTLLALFVFSTTVLAQFDTAVVFGTVRDASASVVPGANVVLLNIETGIQSTASSDENGSYQFLNVKVGTYKISAEKPGFSTAFADNVKVTVNARQRVDLTLTVGQVTETVEVTSGIDSVETGSSDRG